MLTGWLRHRTAESGDKQGAPMGKKEMHFAPHPKPFAEQPGLERRLEGLEGALNVNPFACSCLDPTIAAATVGRRRPVRKQKQRLPRPRLLPLLRLA